MKFLQGGLAGLFALALSGTVNAGVIDFPSGDRWNNIAANVPANGNVWTGLAESFTAQDSNVLFGFYIANYGRAAAVTDSLVFTLYSGDGLFSNVLDQVTANVTNLPSRASELVQVDFSSTTLTPGNQYTVVVSPLSQGLPQSGTYSDLGVSYNSINNSYADGRFYFVGASYNQSLPAFANRDLAFKVTPVNAVPEPETYTLILLSLGLLGIAQRRRNSSNPMA